MSSQILGLCCIIKWCILMAYLVLNHRIHNKKINEWLLSTCNNKTSGNALNMCIYNPKMKKKLLQTNAKLPKISGSLCIPWRVSYMKQDGKHKYKCKQWHWRSERKKKQSQANENLAPSMFTT